MKKPTVKLNDGTTVPLEVFITWHHVKQNNKTLPISELKKKIQKRAEKNKRPVITPIGTFGSVKEASKKTGINLTKLISMLKNIDVSDYRYVDPKPADYRKFEDKPKNKRFSKVTITPHGKFDTLKEAAESHGMSTDRIRNLMRFKPQEYYFFNIGPRTLEEIKNVVKVKKVRVVNYKISSEKRKKIRVEAAKKIMRAVLTPYGKFDSVGKAAKALEVSMPTLLTWIHNKAITDYNYADPNHLNPDKVFYKKPKNGNNLCLSTPFGIFKTKNDASKALGISCYTIEQLVKRNKKEYFYCEHQLSINFAKITVTPNGRYPSKQMAALQYFLPIDQFEYLLRKFPNKFYLIDSDGKRIKQK